MDSLIRALDFHCRFVYFSVHPAVEGACDVAFELNQLRKAILSSDHQMRMAVVCCVCHREVVQNGDPLDLRKVQNTLRFQAQLKP